MTRQPNGNAQQVVIAERIRSDLLDRIGQTIGLVGDATTTPQTLVHEMRKNIKKVRAGLRLLADAGRLDLKNLDEDCAMIARGLSDLRDCDVALQTTHQLAEQSTDDTDARRWREFESRLRSRREAFIDAGVLDPASMRQRVEQLGAISDRVLEIATGDLDGGRFRIAAKKARKKARKALVKVRRDPAEDNFHRLRKRTKREYYQQQLLLRIGLRSEDRDLETLDHLCQCLGDKQDVVVLARLADDCGVALEPSQRRLLDAQAQALRKESIDLAVQHYA